MGIGNQLNANLNNPRAPTVVTVGFNTGRQPNVAHDTVLSFSCTITNNPTQTATINLQISPDNSSWQAVGGQGSTLEQPSTPYYFIGFVPASWYYQVVPSGTGSSAMSQVTEHYL